MALDSTYVKAHRSPPAPEKSVARSGHRHIRGSRSTKLHLIADLLGRPIVLRLTRTSCRRSRRPGPDGGCRSVPPTDRQPRLRRRSVPRQLARSRRHPGHPRPQQPNRPDPPRRRRYRERWRIEATIGRLKDFRRVATRYDKLARTFPRHRHHRRDLRVLAVIKRQTLSGLRRYSRSNLAVGSGGRYVCRSIDH